MVVGLDRKQRGVKAKVSLKASCARLCLCPHRGAKLCSLLLPGHFPASETRERISSHGATGRLDQPPLASKARALCLNSTWGKASQKLGFFFKTTLVLLRLLGQQKELWREAAHPACEDLFLSSRWNQLQCWSTVTSSLILQHPHNPSLSPTSPQSRNLPRFAV